MRWAPFVLALMSATVALSGCSGGGDEEIQVDPDARPDIALGKGAIAGLLIDDVYRPVPGGLVFMEGQGLTATTDEHGQFQFLDLEPGTYVLLANADLHEAAPINVDVSAGEYTEVEFPSRRVFSIDGRTVTTAFSIFIPCAIDFVADGYVLDCTGDQSGDSFRAFFVSDYTEYGDNATYLVTEMLANKEGRYEVQVRSSGNCSGGERYAVSQFKGTYTRMVMPFNGTSAQSAEASYGPNDDWTNKCKIQTILFADSEGREELQGAGLPFCCGAGAHFGIKGRFIATLFLGEPDVDVEHYCVLAPEGQTC